MSTFSELKRRNVLRVGAAYGAASWLLIQIADTLIPLFALPDGVGRILVIVLAIGFVPALLTAWLFELTPEGFKRESSVSHGSTESVRATRNFDRAIIAVLALALVVFAVDRFVLDPARDARRVADAVEQARTAERTTTARDGPSIAVLAFDDLSPDGDLEYFSDGISIELMELLGKIPNLSVIGWESASWFKGKDASYAEIGEKLGVSHLLEGTVRVASDQVRVTASLIDPGTRTVVWSDSFGPRPMTDIFAIQTEIATEVVDKLRITLAGEFPPLDQTTHEIHSLYLQARQILDTTAPEAERYGYARDLLKQVVEDDPNFFPARIWLSAAYFYLSRIPDLDRAENLRLWTSTGEQAALRWPDRPEIKTFRALQAFENGDYATAAQYLERSLRQDPNRPRVWSFAVNLLFVLGRHAEAVEVGEHVLMLDPICRGCYEGLIRNYFTVRRFDDAVAIHTQAENLGFEMPADAWYAATLLFSGDAEAALAEYRRLDRAPAARLAGSAMAFHALGQTAEYEQALAELNELVRTQPGAMFLPAMVYAFVGENDRAFEALNGVPRLGPAFATDPQFDGLREHRRYKELLKKAGISPDDWRDEIEFNFELPE